MQSERPDDNVDLIELLLELWAKKWFILGIVTLFVAAGVAYALLAKPVYRAQVVLATTGSEQTPSLSGGLGGLADLAGISLPRGSDSRHSVAALRSRIFIEEFIAENDLLPTLFADEWDEQNDSWISGDPDDWPDLRDGVQLFDESVRSVDEDESTGLVTLSIDWSDPDVAAQWAGELVSSIDERLRVRDLAASERRLEILNDQLAATNLVELRQAIASLIENQIETQMLAQAESEYAFQVIDPPRAPKQRIAPRRKLIVIVFAFLGGAVAVFTVLLRLAVNTYRRSSGADG
jgi:LPS O-antigen subunit length determinant protein (WzzB/FepE family)